MMSDPLLPGSPLPVQTVLDYASPGADLRERPVISGVGRFCGMYAGVGVPIVAFGFSVVGFPLGPDWQSGKFADYVRLFLSARSAWPFFPLIGFCVLCMALVCASPRRMGSRFWVRVGIYGGVILAGQYCAIMAIGMGGDSIEAMMVTIACVAGAALIPWPLVMLLNFLLKRWGHRKVWLTIASLVAGMLLIVAALSPRNLAAPFGVVLIGSLLAGPSLALSIYLGVSIKLRRMVRETAAEGNSPAADGAAAKVATPIWFGAYAASWALAVQQAIRAYQALPTSPPNRCYIASAAARGHKRVVKGRRGPDGAVINDQLCRLKCGEIALAAIWPGGHRIMRRIYDGVGPVLARGLVNSVSADVAYFLLKPAEWAVVFCLRRVVPDFDFAARGVYAVTITAEREARKTACCAQW